MDAVVFVALAGVAPVGHEDAAIRRGEEFGAAEPRVADGEEIRAVFRHVAAAAAFEVFHVHAAAPEIDGEKFAPKLLRPHAALVDEAALVRVAAAESVRAVFRLARFGPLAGGGPVEVVGMLLDEAVGVRREILAVHALVMRAGDEVPQVPDDRVDEKALAELIPVHAPRIRGPARHDLENLAHGMIAPDRAVHRRALRVGRAGCADVRGGLDAVASVEPAVRAPAETVHDVVPHGAEVEAVEHHHGLSIRDIVAVFIREKKELRRAQRPHAAEADLDAREPLHLIGEDGALVEMAVVIRVFEDHDAVALREIEAHLGLAVGVVFRHPQPPARIRRHRDGLLHVRLAGEKGDLETGRRFDRGERVRRGHRVAGLRVHRRGEIRGACVGHEREKSERRSAQERPFPKRCHPERSGGGKAGAAQSKDPGGSTKLST